MRKKWCIQQTDKVQEGIFAQQLGVSNIVAAILLHRGMDDVEKAKKFLYAEQEPFYDPFLMKDMDKAAARIEQAITQNEKVVVYGDYDVDGITSTALLTYTLKQLGADVSYYIPDRQKEGYGFNYNALHKLYEDGNQLLISVDCGISAMEEVRQMQGKLDIVITDHHLPGNELPSAAAVVNPHRLDCPYPFKDLAGVGVAFKLCQALWKILRHAEFVDLLELVALGTVADIVPLLDENRKIVKEGLLAMQSSTVPGCRMLLEAAGIGNKDLTAGDIGFVLAPRLNAAGRIGHAKQGVELLLSDNVSTAQSLAEALNEKNADRQLLEHDILSLVEQKVKSIDVSKAHVFVIDGEGWHPGVIGIVASRIVDQYYRPTIIISISDGMGKGSCRSIKGFHMYEALTACQEFLKGYGGHAMAAGLTIEANQIQAFREALDTYASAHLRPDDYIPEIAIEREMKPTEADFSLVEELKQLEPFGMGNPRPLFGCRGIRGSYAQSMGSEGRHLRFQIEDASVSVRAIAWNKGACAGLVNREPMDIVYVPEINEWNGRKSLQCKIEDMMPASAEPQSLTRDVLRDLYLFLRKLTMKDSLPYTDQQIWQKYNMERVSISLELMKKALAVFLEIGILTLHAGTGYYHMLIVPGKKFDLMQSATYCTELQKNDKIV